MKDFVAALLEQCLENCKKKNYIWLKSHSEMKGKCFQGNHQVRRVSRRFNYTFDL